MAGYRDDDEAKGKCNGKLGWKLGAMQDVARKGEAR